MSTRVTNSIPTPLNDILVKLKILSMIESGKKINMGNMTFTDASSWLGAFQRGLQGEGKKSMIVHLNQIVDQAIAAINEYQYTEFCGIIVNHLAQARVGIQNLTTTYTSHPKTVAQIMICLENIDLQLKKNQSLLFGHQPSVSKSAPESVVYQTVNHQSSEVVIDNPADEQEYHM